MEVWPRMYPEGLDHQRQDTLVSSVRNSGGSSKNACVGQVLREIAQGDLGKRAVECQRDPRHRDVFKYLP
jgi:hypothetical protein